MKITSRLYAELPRGIFLLLSVVFLLLSTGGCTDDGAAVDSPKQPVANSSQEPDVSDAHSTSHDDRSATPTLSMFDLSTALPAADLPRFLQDQLQETPAVVTVAEFQGIDKATQEEVKAAIEKAIAHYRQQAAARRAGHTPAEAAVTNLEAFLKAAVQ